MAEQVTQPYRVQAGRGLNGEPYDDDVLELSVDMPTLGSGSEFELAMLPYELRPHRAWMPLTTVVAGEPELVWGSDDGLIPTHVPVPPLMDDVDRFTRELDGTPTEP
jgi:hypothetical protein